MAALSLLTGCECVHSMALVFHKTDTKAVKAAKAQSNYEKLAAKARAGDQKAARDLAKWCYEHDEDSERAKYWLGVAAQNGDESAGKIAEHVEGWQ